MQRNDLYICIHYAAFSKDNGDAIIGTTSAKAIESTTKVPPTKPVVDICLTQGAYH